MKDGGGGLWACSEAGARDSQTPGHPGTAGWPGLGNGVGGAWAEDSDEHHRAGGMRKSSLAHLQLSLA